LLLLGGEFTVGAKFAGKVLGVRRILFFTSIILSGVIVPVGIVVGLGSGIVVVIGATGVVVGVAAAVLVRRRTRGLTGRTTGVVVQS